VLRIGSERILNLDLLGLVSSRSVRTPRSECSADHKRVTVLDFACGTGTFLLEVFQRASALINDDVGLPTIGHFLALGEELPRRDKPVAVWAGLSGECRLVSQVCLEEEGSDHGSRCVVNPFVRSPATMGALLALATTPYTCFSQRRNRNNSLPCSWP
jgi:hypothetical protein